MEMMSQEVGKLMEALAKAQAEIGTAKKEAANPFFKTNYADLKSVWNACRDALSANGLSVSMSLTFVDGKQALCGILGHSSGQWIKSLMIFPEGGKKDAQGMGSTITYFRRYILSSLVGVCTGDDDDGESDRKARTEEYSPAIPPQNADLITGEQARNINELIADDKAYADAILKFYSNKYEKQISFFNQIPSRELDTILKKIHKRNEELLKKEMETIDA